MNHLGHFYMTLELLPIILSSAPDARIVFVSSDGHRIAFSFDPNNLQGEQRYDRLKQYGSSKLFNVCIHPNVLFVLYIIYAYNGTCVIWSPLGLNLVAVIDRWLLYRRHFTHSLFLTFQGGCFEQVAGLYR